MAYPKEQMSLVILDTFKAQDNDALRELCDKNNCEIEIISLSLTNNNNKFQPLDLSVNKTAKAHVSKKYNTLMSNEISKQFKIGIVTVPPDIKVFLLLLVVIKYLHAKWIVDLYHHLKADKEMIVNKFRAAGTSEAINNAQEITEKGKNPFKEL